MIDLDAMFQGGLMPPWFKEFAAAPVQALAGLLVGRANLGTLSAEEPTNVLLDWLDRFGEAGGFAVAVDKALAGWIESSWRRPVLDAAMGSGSLTAVAWVRAANVIGVQQRLEGAAQALRCRVLVDRGFLEGLNEGRTRDPQGRAWWAIARHQGDRALVDEWWRLCSLPPDEPWYRGIYGVDGIRYARASDDEEGKFRSDVARSLLVFGKALYQRQLARWVEAGMARKEFLRTARLTMSAYPFLEIWEAFWQETVREHGDGFGDWAQELVRARSGAAGGVTTGDRGSLGVRPAEGWTRRAQEIASRLARREVGAIGEAEHLLDAQVGYAARTGETYYAVRSACNFSSVVRDWRAADAERWARLGKELEPWNPHGWSDQVEALAAMGEIGQAIRIGAQAAQRFAHNPVVRTGLAEVLKAAGRLPEAEAVYRETVRQFPDNLFARNGLAEVLKAADRLPEAEAVYRETIRQFPDDVVARSGLAALWNPTVSMDSLEAETTAPGGEAAEGDARQDLSSSELTPIEIQMLLTDVYLLRTWARWVGETGSVDKLRARAQDILQKLAVCTEDDGTAAGESAMLLLDIGDAAQAAELLRHAAVRFRGNARVEYALAKALREASKAEERAYSPEALRQLLGPLRTMGQRNEYIRPLWLLGEGRGYDALQDGVTVEAGVRDAFGRLGRWISLQIAPAGERVADTDGGAGTGPVRPFLARPETDDFSAWWAEQVQVVLFGDQLVTSADELIDIAPLRQRLVDCGSQLDVCEEQYLLRYAGT